VKICSSILVLATLMVHAPAGRADPEPVSTCGAETPNAGRTWYPQHEQWCIACWNGTNCPGGGGGGGSPGDAAARVLYYVLLPIVFVVVPAHSFEVLVFKPPIVTQSSTEAQQEWNDYVKRREHIAGIGRGAASSRGDLAKALAPPATAQAIAHTPVPIIHLVPSLEWECKDALVAGWANTGYFTSETDMRQRCRPFYKDPEGSDSTCTVAGSRPCDTARSVCCPERFPIYNPCDAKCYESTDFRGSPTEEGKRCERATDCAATYLAPSP
jgi:hypothetical protein